MTIIEKIMQYQEERELSKQPYSWANEAKNILEEVCEANGMDIPKNKRNEILEPVIQMMIGVVYDITRRHPIVTEEDRVDAHADQIVFNIGALMKLGYDPTKVLEEAYKEISSRKGKIEDGKFQKFTDKISKSLWYKADYTKTKLV